MTYPSPHYYQKYDILIKHFVGLWRIINRIILKVWGIILKVWRIMNRILFKVWGMINRIIIRISLKVLGMIINRIMFIV